MRVAALLRASVKNRGDFAQVGKRADSCAFSFNQQCDRASQRQYSLVLRSVLPEMGPFFVSS